jgi:site-specific recombinase XerC
MTQGSVVTLVWTGDGIHGTMTDNRAFARWLHEAGHIEALPKVSLNKLPQVFSPIPSDAELDWVFRTKHLSMSTEIGIRNRAMIAFMLDTGVRRTEVAHLDVKDLDVPEGPDHPQGPQGAVRNLGSLDS